MSNLSSIKSIVVLMMENRSFDNFVGWIYPGNVSPSGDPYNGLTTALWNPPNPQSSEKVYAGSTTDHKNPSPDPGEVFHHVNIQLFQSDPPPNPLPSQQCMGFLYDYTNVVSEGSYQTDPTVIMDGFDPSVVSCTQAIASQFAICDQWFCSMPSQTWPNRSFVHAATSNGNLNNFPYDPGLWDVPTIFNVMSRRPGSTWRVYYDDLFIPLTWLQMRQLHPLGYWKNFKGITDFLDDAQNGNLPQYAFVEPSFFPNPITGPETDAHPPHNAFIGDQFIGKIYNAIVTGPQFQANEVLFVITFDEHGGCYDHVAPFTNAAKTPQQNELFDFSRFGVRVPTIVVSPFVKAGSVFNVPAGAPPNAPPSTYTPYDHTSILKTIEVCFGYDALSTRDAAAPDLAGVLTGPARTNYTPVPIAEPPADAQVTSESLSTLQLNDLQISMIRALSHLAEPLDGKPTLLDRLETLTMEELPGTVAAAKEFIEGKKEELGLK